MNRIIIIPQIFLILVGFTSCNKDRVWEEGDRNTFTWKGTLYKDFNDQPLANTVVKLEAVYPTSFNTDFEETEVLAEGSTDSNGFFSLTYKRLKGTNGVSLIVNGVPILSSPENVNVSRDFAQTNHIRLFLIAKFDTKPAPDTLFIELPYPLESAFLKNLSFETDNQGIFQRKIFCLPRENYTSGVVLKAELKGKWDNRTTSRLPGYGYGLTLKEIEMVTTSGINDTIPDDFQIEILSFRGFPFVDTLEILL